MSDARVSPQDLLVDITIVPLVIGVVCLLIGIIVPLLVDNSGQAEAYTATTTGEVTHVQEKVSGKKRRKTYVTFVRFEDSDHREFVARNIAVARSRRHAEGDEVTVRYDPTHPASGCLIEGDEDILLYEDALTLSLRAGGIVCIVVGGFLVARRYRALAAA